MQPEIDPINTPVVNREMEKGRLYLLGNPRCPAPPWWVHKSALLATLNQSHFIIYIIFAEHQTEAISIHMLIRQFIPASLIAIVSAAKKQSNYSNCVTLSCSVFAPKVTFLHGPWTKEMIELFFSLYLGKNENPNHHYYLAGRIFRSPRRAISNHNSRNSDKVQPAVFFLRL